MLKLFKIKNWLSMVGCLSSLLGGVFCLSNYNVNCTFADDATTATTQVDNVADSNPVKLKEEVSTSANRFLTTERLNWLKVLSAGLPKDLDISEDWQKGNYAEFLKKVYALATFCVNYFSDSTDANVASNLENVSCVSEVLKCPGDDSSDAGIFAFSLFPNANEAQYNVLKNLKNSDLSTLKLRVVDANANEVLGLGVFDSIKDESIFEENDPKVKNLVEMAKYVILNIYNRNKNAESQITENSAAYKNFLERLKKVVSFTGLVVVPKDKLTSNSKLRYEIVNENGSDVVASFEVPSIGEFGSLPDGYFAKLAESLQNMF